MTTDPSETHRIIAAMDDVQRIALARAADAWPRLPEAARDSLLRRQVTQELWGLSFGYELGRYLTRSVVDARSAEVATHEAWSTPNHAVDALAVAHVNRMLRGNDPVIDGAVVRWVLEDLESASPTTGDRLATPFDPLVDQLWGRVEDEGVRLGPVRLVGCTPVWIVGIFLGILAWVPATLAQTHRLLHGDRTVGTLARAVVGWLGIALVLTWIVLPK